MEKGNIGTWERDRKTVFAKKRQLANGYKLIWSNKVNSIFNLLEFGKDSDW